MFKICTDTIKNVKFVLCNIKICKFISYISFLERTKDVYLLVYVTFFPCYFLESSYILYRSKGLSSECNQVL